MTQRVKLSNCGPFKIGEKIGEGGMGSVYISQADLHSSEFLEFLLEIIANREAFSGRPSDKVDVAKDLISLINAKGKMDADIIKKVEQERHYGNLSGDDVEALIKANNKRKELVMDITERKKKRLNVIGSLEELEAAYVEERVCKLKQCNNDPEKLMTFIQHPKKGLGIYLPEDLTFVIKTLPPSSKFEGGYDDKVGRLARESRNTMACVDENGRPHKNVVTAYTAGKNYFVMEYVKDTKKSDQMIDEFSLSRKLEVIIETANGLACAHGKGIIHRDIKPDNILITDSLVKLTDFGLAKKSNIDRSYTQTGVGMGTPTHMPPEQVSDAKGGCDERSDIYSLGATLYELVVGKPPFYQVADKGNAVDVMMAVMEGIEIADINEKFSSPRKANRLISPELDQIILKMMAPEKSRRIQSMGEVIETLQEYKRIEDEDTLGMRQSVVSAAIDKAIAADTPSLRMIIPERKAISDDDEARPYDESAEEEIYVKPEVQPQKRGQKRKSPGRRRTPARGTRKIEAVKTPIYKKPTVLAGVGLGLAGLAFGAYLALKEPAKAPDISSFMQNYTKIETVFNQGDYEIESQVSELDNKIQNVLKEFPKNAEYAGLKTKLDDLLAKNKQCKEYIKFEKSFEQDYTKFEKSYSEETHKDIDKKADSLLALLEKTPVNKKVKRKQSIAAKKYQAVTLKHTSLYKGVELEFNKVKAKYEEISKQEYDKTKLNSLVESLKKVEENLKPVNIRRVDYPLETESLAKRINAVYDGIKALRAKDPVGIVANAYTDAERAFNAVKNPKDKRAFRDFYGKLASAKTELEKIKAKPEYSDISKKLNDLTAKEKSQTQLLSEAEYTFETADLSDFKGKAEVKDGKLIVTSRIDLKEPFKTDSISYDAKGNHGFFIGDKKFLFDEKEIKFGDTKVSYKNKGTNYIEYENGKGLYVNGQLMFKINERLGGNVTLSSQNCEVDNIDIR